MRGSDLEALQSLLRGTAGQLGGELDEGDVVPVRDESHLLEARELVEQHGQHHLVRLLGQVGEEEDLIRRLFRVAVDVHGRGCVRIRWIRRFLRSGRREIDD